MSIPQLEPKILKIIHFLLPKTHHELQKGPLTNFSNNKYWYIDQLYHEKKRKKTLPSLSHIRLKKKLNHLQPTKHVGFNSQTRNQLYIPQDSLDLKVKDVAGFGGWDWSLVPFELPPDIKAEIRGIPTPVIARGGDKLAWKRSSSGAFDLWSAYTLATSSSEVHSFPGRWIWKLHTLPKIWMLVWKCMHRSNGVKDCLARRGIVLDTACPLCHREVETITHALRD